MRIGRFGKFIHSPFMQGFARQKTTDGRTLASDINTLVDVLTVAGDKIPHKILSAVAGGSDDFHAVVHCIIEADRYFSKIDV
jgi:hypothetical protein